jgi:hypothetical protein
MGAVPRVPECFAGTGGTAGSDPGPNALLRGVNRIDAPHTLKRGCTHTCRPNGPAGREALSPHRLQDAETGPPV